MYKRQGLDGVEVDVADDAGLGARNTDVDHGGAGLDVGCGCLLYTSDAADERSSVGLGGRRIIKKKNKYLECRNTHTKTKQEVDQ